MATLYEVFLWACLIAVVASGTYLYRMRKRPHQGGVVGAGRRALDPYDPNNESRN